MRKEQWLFILLAVSMLIVSGCVDQTVPETAGQIKEETEMEAETEAEVGEGQEEEPDDYLGKGTVGSKWYASIIAGAINEETTVSLKDDYFTAVNLEYLAGLTIEDGSMTAGVYNDAKAIMEERTLGLLQVENPKSHDGELVKNLYELAIDWEGRNQAGMEPILENVNRIQSLASIDDIKAFEASSKDLFFPVLTEIAIDDSLSNPGYYTVSIYPTPLFLGDAQEYSEQSENGALDEAYYNKLVSCLLEKLAFSEEEINTVLDECKTFETATAEHMITLEEYYADDILDRIINEYTLEELREIQGNYPLVEILEALGLDGSDTYNLCEPEWLSALSALYTEENTEIIKSYILAHYAADMAGKLDKEMFDTTWEYVNERYGMTGTRTDEKIGLDVINTYLSNPMDYVYIDAYCSAEERQEVIEMVQKFIAYYRKLLEQEDWLSEETKQQAIEKLENITIKACYADTREDYSRLTFASKAEGGTYMEALQAIMEYNLVLMQEKINQPVNPDLWSASTREVNAYYTPTENSLTILCGTLVGDFAMDQPYEAVLATVGAQTIGHEISHAFDTLGAQFDKDGNYDSWWKEEDYTAFQERAKRLTEYLNQIIPYEGAPAIRGELETGEMIADLGGMKTALMIAQDIEDFDYDAFFRAAAKGWATILTKNIAISQMQSDAHPLDNLRVNIPLQHCDEFLETYDIQPGDGMYLAPEDRVNVW